MSLTRYLISFVILLMGCENDPPKTISSVDLIGIWFGYLNSATSCDIDSNNGVNTCADYCNYYNFTADTFVLSSKLYEVTGTYSIKGDSIFFIIEPSMVTDKRSFKLEGNILKLSRQGTQGCVYSNHYERK